MPPIAGGVNGCTANDDVSAPSKSAVMAVLPATARRSIPCHRDPGGRCSRLQRRFDPLLRERTQIIGARRSAQRSAAREHLRRRTAAGSARSTRASSWPVAGSMMAAAIDVVPRSTPATRGARPPSPSTRACRGGVNSGRPAAR